VANKRIYPLENKDRVNFQFEIHIPLQRKKQWYALKVIRETANNLMQIFLLGFFVQPKSFLIQA